ncbi:MULTISPECIES: hypothetical protein [unclassified Geodermatophilus]
MSGTASLPLSVLEPATVGSGRSTADPLAATTRVAQAADRLALPGQLLRPAIRTDRPRPVPTPEEARTAPERAAAESTPSNAVVGDPAQVAAQLRELAAATGADALMLSASTHGVAERVRSLELVAAARGLVPEATAA